MKSSGSQELSETDALLAEVARVTNREKAEIKFIYAAFCEAALRHFTVAHHSLDLGFAVIHAVPLRANWKNYLLQRLPNMGQLLKRKPMAEQRRLIEEHKFLGEIVNADQLAVKRGLVHFTLEIVPKRNWWYFMLHWQKKLLAQLGPSKYCRYIGRAVGRFYERSIGAYLSHLAQIALPAGDVCQGRYLGGESYIIARIPKGRVRPSTVEVRLGAIVVPNNPDVFASQMLTGEAHEPGKGVLSLPDVQQGIKDLRDGPGTKPD